MSDQLGTLLQGTERSSHQGSSQTLSVICTRGGAIIPEALRNNLQNSKFMNVANIKKVPFLATSGLAISLALLSKECFFEGSGTPFDRVFESLTPGFGLPLPWNMVCGRAEVNMVTCGPHVNSLFQDVIGEVVVAVFRDLGCPNSVYLYEVVSAQMLLASERANRTPLMSTERRGSSLYETMTIVVPLVSAVYIGFWDETVPSHPLEGLHLVCPLLCASSAYVFSCVPFCFVPPKAVDTQVHTVASIVINLCHVRSRSNVSRGTAAMLPYDLWPEQWIVKAATVPGIMPCAICCAPIRQRQLGNLMGDKHDLQRVTGGGAHCVVCKEMGAPFMVCEVCLKLGPRPVHARHDDVHRTTSTNRSAEFMYGFLFGQHSSSAHTIYSRCTHLELRSFNYVEDVLFTILHPREIRAAAIVFVEFTLWGTWIKAFAPTQVLNGDRREVWQAWMHVFLRNASCSRVRMSFFAVQFALDFCGMFFVGGPQKRSRLLKREFYFDDTQFLDPKAKTAIQHRLQIAQDLANGFFDKDVLKRMALRVLRYIQESEWGQTSQCSCALVIESTGTTSFSSGTQCSGPHLDISADPGSDENLRWGALQEGALRARSLLRQFQAHLEEGVHKRRVTFDANRHYNLKAVS